MRRQLRSVQSLRQVLVAVVSSSLAFSLLRTALHPHASVFDPLTNLGDYLAVGVTAVIFCVILYRLRRGTWTREQVDEVLGIDDESV
jgi:hypothetical protein